MTWSADLLLALVLAAGTEVPARLADRVRAAVAEGWGVDAAAIRLEWGRLATRDSIGAEAPFRLLGSGRDGRYVVTVRTSAGGETAVTVRAGVLDSVWVAARPVSMGSRLSDADLARAERLVWGAPGDRAGASPRGWEVRRNLAAGELVAAPAVAEPPLVESGDRVRFVWERDGFMVVREGVATTRARMGERVVARDQSRGDQLSGVVTGPGRARLEGKGIR